MPETYIDPKVVLGALTPKKATIAADLGPSAPHEPDPIEAEVSILAMTPKGPPILGVPHYTQTLDQLWPEFDDPEERTAERLDALLSEVADEALKVHKFAQQIWEDMPAYKVLPSERTRYDREFLAYLRRLNEYRQTLNSLEPDSTDTESVYVGLVKRKQGAGPVPDAIMHMYFAEQLGILAEHSEDMGELFVGRVLRALTNTGRKIHQAAEAARDSAAEAGDAVADGISDAATAISDRLTRIGLWIGGIFLGTVVVGGIVFGVVASRGNRE